MAQISRPFQIALVAVVLLAGVWFFALQGHSSGTSGSGFSPAVASTSTPTPTATPAKAAKGAAATGVAAAHAAAAHAAATHAAASGHATGSSSANGVSGPTHVYHGPAPGVEGLTRAIVRAHEAIAVNEHKNAEVQRKSAQASSEAASTTGSSSSSTAAKAPAQAAGSSVKSSAAKPSTAAPKSPKSSTPVTKPSTTANSPSLAQQTVEATVAAGGVAIVYFWNPRGSDDRADGKALLEVERGAVKSHELVVSELATAQQVAEYGSITRGVQIYSTPTMLVINKAGHAIVLTGLQDRFTIDQAVEEALHPQPAS
jgi:hypothetical protein